MSDMQGTTITDRYRHRLRGQLESDGALLDAYLRGEGATVIALPLTGAPAPVSNLSLLRSQEPEQKGSDEHRSNPRVARPLRRRLGEARSGRDPLHAHR